LLPLVRKGTGELLTGIGLAAANEQGEPDDPLLGVIGYVEPELAHEYELVMVAEAQLTGYLAHLPGESRLNGYRHILRHTRLRNSLKLPPLQDVAKAIASGSVPSSAHQLPPQMNQWRMKHQLLTFQRHRWRKNQLNINPLSRSRRGDTFPNTIGTASQHS
jgi:hypothetical protein